MRIALIGYGKMGKEVEKIALERGHTISLRVTKENADFSPLDLKETDVAIEFSVPSAAKKNIFKCFDATIPIVVGTTAWYNDFELIESECLKKNAALFYASNFSLGVNIFWKITEYISQLMNNYPDYNISINEIHHTEKLDTPSGTAITTAKKILENSDQYNDWFYKENKTLQHNQLPITASRLPNVPGTHTVSYSSAIDEIELKHEAKNRKGFALGSLLAAEFLQNKKGVYSMNDLLKK